MKVTITSRYGEFESFRTHPHRGIDLNFETGTEVHSVGSGVVDKVVDYGDRNLGKGVFIKQDNGETSVYGHMDDIHVHEGQHVNINDVVGHSGDTGHSTGAHLHFQQMNEQGQTVDPTDHFEYLVASSGNSTGNAVIEYFKGFKERGMTASEGGYYNLWGDTILPYLATEGKEFMIECFNYLTMHLPEIFGGITIIAGGLIMLGLRVPKVASFYGISLVVAAFWKMSA